MSVHRGSTLPWLSLLAAVAVAAFYAGRLASPAPVLVAGPTVTVSQNPPVVSRPPVEVVPVAPPAPVENLGKHWDELAGQPRTPAGENELAALLEKMAEADPQRALALATAQTNVRLRAALLRATLKGWGKTNPEAAVQWVQTQTVMDAAQAVTALLQGAVQDPARAASVTTALMQNDPSRAAEFGGDLISALTEAGHFDQAANFAASGAASDREGWLLPAYSRWAEFQPQAALASALQIADAGVRETALNAIIIGWSPSDPKGMVEYAQNHLQAGQQNTALQNALGFWADSDPVAAATWINQNPAGPQTDPGVAQIALSPQLAQNPALATTWAENISNPQLRLETLTTLIEKWTAVDQAAAENYINNSAVLAPEDRAQLLERTQMLAKLKEPL